MHTIVEPTRAGIYVPLSNRERIALYRARIDETSEFHRDRALAGLALRASLGMAPFPAASSTDARRPAFTSCVCATRQLQRHGAGRPPAADDAGTFDDHEAAREYAEQAAAAELWQDQSEDMG